MSDNWLRFIATDPHWVPNGPARDAAVGLLVHWLPDADEVTSNVSDHVEFIDQGANFERVACPACGIGLSDDWWSAAMDRASETDFEDLSVSTPCGHATSLNDLDYDWPAGFARFVIEALNPGVEELSDDQMSELTRALGTPLRRIWAHY